MKREAKIPMLPPEFPRWSALRGFGNSPPAKATILIPLIGYLVIFNDKIVQFLELSSQITGASGTYGASISPRLLFIYFGLTLIALGTAIYSMRCPAEVKYYGSSAAYVRGDGPSLGDFAMEEIERLLRESRYRPDYVRIRDRYEPPDTVHTKPITDEQKRQVDNGVLHLYFRYLNNSHPNMIWLTLCCYVLGTVCLGTASIDIFLRVTAILLGVIETWVRGLIVFSS
jgi:hypothetical protein